jgi:large subunit ribosomal protein L9
MKVVLLRDVKKVGKKGDICEVPQGYAHNFLIKQKHARAATIADEHMQKAQKEDAEKIQERTLQKKYELLKALDGETIVMKEKANEKGSLFGKVTDDNFFEALNAKTGNTYTPELLISKDIFPIKQLGEYEVTFGFEKVQAKITLEVIAE